ncbi:DUF4257 domain-containing protein [Bacillus cereus group sp. MG9]|uniref:DUF4257 domain-containing protein n=1 Tax=Bacillus cereus group sp. MG9 TaxID=3040247 RepID=UPI003390DF10
MLITVIVTVVTVVAGMVSGLASHYITNKKFLLPRKSKLAFHPGFLEEMFVGSIASLVGVAMFNPETTMDILKVSILAGISGQAFLLHNRLATEQVKTDEIQSISKKLTELEKKNKE